MMARAARWLATGLALAALLSTSPAPAAGRHAAKAGKAAKAAKTAKVTADTTETSDEPAAKTTKSARSGKAGADATDTGDEPGARKAKTTKGAKASKAGADATDTGGEPGARLRRVRGGMHLEVKARDLRLREADEEKLRRIAGRYFKATRKRLVVTGGTRTPERQAALMIEKLRHHDDLLALYEHKAAATEIQNAYRDAAGRPRKQVARVVTEVIKAQMAKGIYVSKHLQSGAVDVRSWGMTAPLEKALKVAIKEEPGVGLLDERNGPEPHFHLNL